jgi:hypothetical protein
MTRVDVKFVPSYKPKGRSPGFEHFGRFMVSDQIRKPLRRAAIDIIAVAKVMVPRSKDERDGHYTDKFSIQGEGLETLVFDSRVGKMNRHAMVQISNHAKNAIAVEFGSGWPSKGTTKGAERKAEQGGWNKAMRPLGRAGRKVGRAVEAK